MNFFEREEKKFVTKITKATKNLKHIQTAMQAFTDEKKKQT